MTRRVFISILLVTLISLFASLGFLTAILFPYFDDKISNELIKELYYLVPGANYGGAEYLSAIDSQGNRITLIDSDGTVLYDNFVDPSSLDNHADREEVIEALSGQIGKSIRQSNSLGMKFFNFAVLLENNTVLRLSSSQYSMAAVLLSLIQPILIVLFLTAILSAVFAYRVSRKLTQPLNEIDLENPIPANAPYEELKPLLRRLHYQNQQINAQIEQLQSQQQQFSAITDNMQEGLLVLDPSGKILSYNNSITHLLKTHKSLLGVNVYSLHQDDSFYDTIQNALQGQHSETLIHYNSRIYRLFSNPVLQNNAVAGAILVLLDVTEQHQREALRREFSANVSHELKTPLTSISGIAEIMSSDLMEASDVPQFAKKIYNESQRLIKLVQDIIKISQLDENTFPQQAELVDLHHIAACVISRLETAASAQQVEITLSGESAYIQGVASILDEMVFNICENAIKYNNAPGYVFVQVENAHNEVILTVKDTGIGIPSEHQARVFERFYRVDKSHSRAIGGTGLGLSIVKHGAALHHAHLSLESEPEQGTEIKLVFPTSSSGSVLL